MKRGRSQLEGHLPPWWPDDTSITRPAKKNPTTSRIPNLAGAAHWPTRSLSHIHNSGTWMKGRSDNQEGH